MWRLKDAGLGIPLTMNGAPDGSIPSSAEIIFLPVWFATDILITDKRPIAEEITVQTIWKCIELARTRTFAMEM